MVAVLLFSAMEGINFSTNAQSILQTAMAAILLPPVRPIWNSRQEVLQCTVAMLLYPASEFSGNPFFSRPGDRTHAGRQLFPQSTTNTANHGGNASPSTPSYGFNPLPQDFNSLPEGFNPLQEGVGFSPREVQFDIAGGGNSASESGSLADAVSQMTIDEALRQHDSSGTVTSAAVQAVRGIDLASIPWRTIKIAELKQILCLRTPSDLVDFEKADELKSILAAMKAGGFVRNPDVQSDLSDSDLKHGRQLGNQAQRIRIYRKALLKAIWNTEDESLLKKKD
eukprot:CAMPEP_0178769674 /NCGR_PEP_ID=MMETSP0744-20121128/20966_1 /TAXON_ID=913974 /ORGANISM="Nitzschia punctata, Strain CCMP561" /LENGTH=281 /DNA_ID=CAMNT_0020425963 /DNA_START=27 /DNA_END=873 /DNA_ORIENTATION=+